MNAVVLSSEIGSQKCCLPVAEFVNFQCHVGCPVKVTTNKGTFICKTVPRTDLKSDVIIENTVQVYSERKKFLVTHPLVSRDFSVSILNLKPATHLTVTIVNDSF
jgi:hypothetical protein